MGNPWSTDARTGDCMTSPLARGCNVAPPLRRLSCESLDSMSSRLPTSWPVSTNSIWLLSVITGTGGSDIGDLSGPGPAGDAIDPGDDDVDTRTRSDRWMLAPLVGRRCGRESATTVFCALARPRIVGAAKRSLICQGLQFVSCETSSGSGLSRHSLGGRAGYPAVLEGALRKRRRAPNPRPTPKLRVRLRAPTSPGRRAEEAIALVVEGSIPTTTGSGASGEAVSVIRP